MMASWKKMIQSNEGVKYTSYRRQLQPSEIPLDCSTQMIQVEYFFEVMRGNKPSTREVARELRNFVKDEPDKDNLILTRVFRLFAIGIPTNVTEDCNLGIEDLYGLGIAYPDFYEGIQNRVSLGKFCEMCRTELGNLLDNFPLRSKISQTEISRFVKGARKDLIVYHLFAARQIEKDE